MAPREWAHRTAHAGAEAAGAEHLDEEHVGKHAILRAAEACEAWANDADARARGAAEANAEPDTTRRVLGVAMSER
jgi:hypothetical protein